MVRVVDGWMRREGKRKSRSVGDGDSYTRRKSRREVRVDAKVEERVKGGRGVDLGNRF